MHVHDHTPVERDDVSQTGIVDLETPDELRGRPFENPDDPSLGAVGLMLPLDPRHDAIAVHRLIEVRSSDIEISRDALHGVVGGHKTEATRIHVHATRDETHPVRNPVAVTPDLDQRPRVDERVEPASERDALCAVEPEPLQQLPNRGGMIQLRADRLEEFFW